MTAVTADHPGREETWDPPVCMAKSALHGNRRAAGGETHRQHPSWAASLMGSTSLTGSIPRRQRIPRSRAQLPSQALRLSK